MQWILVDNGSSMDILYYPAFQQMGIDRGRLIPTNALLVGWRLPSANHQGRDIPSGRLLVCLQCYPRMTHPQFVEGCNLNLPPND